MLSVTFGDGASTGGAAALANQHHMAASARSITISPSLELDALTAKLAAAHLALDGEDDLIPPETRPDRFMLSARLQSVATLNRPAARLQEQPLSMQRRAKRIPNRVVWREHRTARLILPPTETGKTPHLVLVKSDRNPDLGGQKHAA